MKIIKFVGLVLVSLLLIYADGCNLIGPTQEEDNPSSVASVTVYLNSGGSETFEYNSFTGYPSRLRDSNCTSHTISKSEMTETKMYGKTYCSCDKKNRWEYRIYYSNTSKVGHYTDSEYHSVSGKDINTSQTKYVSWENISSIQFNK